MKELGVFCGTFNPIHWGHLLLAECARDQFQLGKVLFITSARPPHRNNDLLPARARHQMVAAAVADNPCFEASDIELARPGPSYTVDTLKDLKSRFGAGTRLNLIIGNDNLKYLPQWHQAEEILRLCRLLVAPRPGQEARPAERRQAEMACIEFPLLDISGSEIRRRLRKGMTVLYMVPPAVNSLLLSEGYYQRQESGEA